MKNIKKLFYNLTNLTNSSKNLKSKICNYLLIVKNINKESKSYKFNINKQVKSTTKYNPNTL